ncbi:hypothetical protein E3T27_11315 [Cryobacterium lyxosi]|uniref:Uncharacterized protein n=1 Tax=Cryobacterium lyxosi TaxID=1259228 RepID=A0A4R8ZEH0_9MICO|nr:hypothetical protein E3T27_11315 [Cryobacterium lyxosi]
MFVVATVKLQELCAAKPILHSLTSSTGTSADKKSTANVARGALAPLQQALQTDMLADYRL